MAQLANLKTPLQYLKGVGPKVSKLLGNLGLLTIEDLLYYFPYEYEDRQNVVPINSIADERDHVLIKGDILHVENQQIRGRLSVLKVSIFDGTASIRVIFFNQPFLLGLFHKGIRLLVTGKVERNKYEGGFQVIPRDWEIDTGALIKILPIYHLTENLYAKNLRKIIKSAIDNHLTEVKEFMPETLIHKYKLKPLLEAIKTLHFPEDQKDVQSCKNRIIFEDFFLFQLGLGLRKTEVAREKGVSFDVSKSFLDEFPMPFKLTNAQERVLSDILSDMKSDKPMNRLLQGDVGSGKTVIAAIAAFIAIKNGYQAAIMAPTEILAQQHYAKVQEWFKGYKVVLATGTTQRKDKRDKFDEDLIIGTHALLEDKIKFNKLGLVIIDEQHRFGVLQRSLLSQKGKNPDIIFMTATPIPRSLALTLYGDLDRSIIDEMPPGRTPVKTHYVTSAKRKSSYEFIRSKIASGQQVFVVCPLVAESEALDLKDATEEAEVLQRNIFPEFKVGLIHGRMKPDEKDRIMQEFRDGKIQVLVSTTVIEVGIDIPNATIMIIEHAERFGLSQLHQLRGRIGRGQDEPFCFLMGSPKTDDAKARIKAMLDTNDGFKIAEVDLKLRGPGDFYGIRQSGLPEFRMADIIRDEEMLRIARDEAFKYLDSDPNLAKSPILKAAFLNRYGKFLGY